MMIKRASRNLLFRSVVLALGLYSLNGFANTFEYRALLSGADASACTPAKLGSATVFSYTGSLQEIPIPAQAIFAKVFVEGAGGGGGGCPTLGATDSGGSGASLYGQISVKAGSPLYVLVGGGGANPRNGSGGGGGLTGIFSGTPSQSTALLVAGGGGGGGNPEHPNAYGNGSNGGLQPGKAITQQLGGMGFGGRGRGVSAYGADGSPFGAGGASTGTYSGPGGFGGGASGGQGWGSGGGGGGMPGGGGGGVGTYGTSYGGQGGTSVAASSVQDVHQGSQTAAGGYGSAPGQSGSASITFYGCP